ncbi:unnamed protein product [Cuscuta campestris]|uniref:CCHC-type domain-containing protein n=1 Tax=Cuscuta campestris TaxID=132261 RepID=A0A484KSC9_9ASTE|nr:unnamed protein product [Cuscuta campestris]
MAGAHVPPPPPPPAPIVSIEKLKRNGAQEFYGDQIADPQIAKRWQERTVRVLENLKVPVEDWGLHAISLLQDAAYDWWKRVGANIPVPVPWTTFEPLFRAEYVPDHYVEAKYEEFSNFTQGKLTLPEYRQQFDGLAEFGKDLVNTMEKRCKKFIKGMRPDLSSTLIIAPRADINDVYKKDLELNEELIRKAAYEQALLAESRAVHSGPKMGHGSKRTFSAPSNSRHDKRAKSTPSTSVAVTSKSGKEKMTYRNPVCPHCNRRHAGECWFTQGLCLGCGQAGHFRNDCPTNPSKAFSTAPGTLTAPPVRRAEPTQSHRFMATSNQPKKPATSQQQGRAPARTYAMQGRTDPQADDVIMGMFTLFDITASALIDPGSTLSYICVPMLFTSDVTKETLEHPIVVSNPLGHSLRLQHVYNQCPLMAQGKIFLADLIELPHKEFDVILGMDWLSKHQAIVECKERVVKLCTDDGNEVIIRGELLPKAPEFISFMQAKRLIRRKCEAFLCTVKDIISAQRQDTFCLETRELVSKGEKQDFSVRDNGPHYHIPPIYFSYIITLPPPSSSSHLITIIRPSFIPSPSSLCRQQLRRKKTQKYSIVEPRKKKEKQEEVSRFPNLKLKNAASTSS